MNTKRFLNAAGDLCALLRAWNLHNDPRFLTSLHELDRLVVLERNKAKKSKEKKVKTG